MFCLNNVLTYHFPNQYMYVWLLLNTPFINIRNGSKFYCYFLMNKLLLLFRDKKNKQLCKSKIYKIKDPQASAALKTKYLRTYPFPTFQSWPSALMTCLNLIISLSIGKLLSLFLFKNISPPSPRSGFQLWVNLPSKFLK